MRSSADPPSRTKKKRIESIIDRPIRRTLRVKDKKFYTIPLSKPLQLTSYVPAKPVPKPRTKRQTPIPLPRNKLPKKVTDKVKQIQKLIDEIAPFYSKPAINEFKKNLKFISKAEIIQKKKALKNNALSFEATIVNNYDRSIQLADNREK